MERVVADEAEQPSPAPAQASLPPAPELRALAHPAQAGALAAALGNRAFGRVLARNGGGAAPAVAEPPAAAGGELPADADWETSGNLHGNPPVRDRHRPPNPNVVEDAGEYGALLDEARESLTRQRERARGYLDERENLRDYRWFFARVYSYVTENEILFCQSSAYFYPSYVLKSVLYFERLYDDNVKAFDRPGARVEDHWRTAFEETARAQRTAEQAQRMMLECMDPDAQGGMALNAMIQSVMGAMSSLTTSMKAHIRYDLPRAEAWVFNQDYRAMPGVRQNDFMADFMSMGGVFDRAGEQLLPEMSQKLGVPLGLIPRMVQDTSMAYIFGADMATERADTWRRSVAVGAEQPNDTGPYSRGPQGVTGDATQSDQMSAIQHLSDPSLRPSMDSPMNSGDDDSAHDDLGTMTDAQIGALPAVRRVQYLRALNAGATIGDDETLVLRILNASAADLVVVVDAANAWDLMYALDGQNATTLRTLLRSSYYARTAAQTALQLVRRCMDGETAEWEEEMVADFIEVRGDRVELVRQIGRTYPGMSGADDFHKGLNKLEWQLDGADEARVHAAMQGDAAAPASESGEWW